MLLSEKNRGKCAMMRRLLREVDSDLIWWVDDDAYVSRIGALPYWLRLVASSKPRVAQWGDAVYCSDIRPYVSEGDPIRFVREAEWYQGLPPPSWRAGGKGEFDFRGKGMGDGRWRFVIGSIWMARASRLKEMDWPDRRLFRNGEDIYLGEALRQHGYSLGRVNLHEAGVVLSAAVRRGAAEEPKVYHDSEEWHLEIVE